MEENYDADTEIDTSDSGHSSCDSLTCQNAAKTTKKPTKDAAKKGGQTGATTELSIGQFAVSKSETVVFGKTSLDPSACPHRQYLLLLNSSALREFFRKKDVYIEAAKKAGAELEFTRLVATLKDTDWPKYQLIEVRAPTKDMLEKFERELLALNPDYNEKVPYDPNKYTCVQAACRFSSYVASDLLGSSTSTEEESDVGGPAAGKAKGGGGGGGKAKKKKDDAAKQKAALPAKSKGAK